VHVPSFRLVPLLALALDRPQGDFATPPATVSRGDLEVSVPFRARPYVVDPLRFDPAPAPAPEGFAGGDIAATSDWRLRGTCR
jgi:hypothetical protein